MRPDEIAKALGASEIVQLDPKNPVADGLRVHRERTAPPRLTQRELLIARAGMLYALLDMEFFAE